MPKFTDSPPTPPLRLAMPRPQNRAAAAQDWARLVDAGLIPNRNPPAPPEVEANRAANEALLRRLFRSGR